MQNKKKKAACEESRKQKNRGIKMVSKLHQEGKARMLRCASHAITPKANSLVLCV